MALSIGSPEVLWRQAKILLRAGVQRGSRCSAHSGFLGFWLLASSLSFPQRFCLLQRISYRVATEEIALAFFSRRETGESFEELMRAHERMVLGVAYRLLGRMEDAQDAAQEVFLRLFQHRARIDGDPKPWLYRVTVNVCNDWYRKRTKVLEPDEQQPDPSPDALSSLTLDERKQLLMEGLATLGERERAAIVLRDVEGLSTREVAEILGVEEVTVRSQISVARVKLTKYVRKRI